ENQNQLVFSGKNPGIKVWDLETGDVTTDFDGGFQGANSLVYDPKSNRLAIASTDRSVQVWKVENRDRNSLGKHLSTVTSVAFSPVDPILASASTDNTIILWDTANDRKLKTLRGHTHAVNSVVFSADGKYLASGSSDKTVRLWDVATGDLRETLQGHADEVLSVAVSPDGKRLASASRDRTIRVWNLEAMVPVPVMPRRAEKAEPQAAPSKVAVHRHELKGQHTQKITSLVFSNDGTLLVSAAADQMVQLWSVENGQPGRS